MSRSKFLDRLLELNHERYAEEVRRGLRTTKRPKPKGAKNTAEQPPYDGLFQPEGSLF